MIRVERSALSSYASGLLAKGRGVFSADEAQKEIGISRGAFLDAAERLQRRGQLIRPRRGFYVVVPPQHSTTGAPPPEWYIDALMRHEKRPYYVGLLAAAAAHGASHQAVMEFQVVTDKLLPDIEAGRTRIVFSYRKDMAAVSAGIEDRKTQSGYMKLSSPELTALDLVRYPQSGAGLDNIATVLSELAERLQPEKLASLSDEERGPGGAEISASGRSGRNLKGDKGVSTVLGDVERLIVVSGLVFYVLSARSAVRRAGTDRRRWRQARG
jgi:predicted transcriptional regulator of viral defense system